AGLLHLRASLGRAWPQPDADVADSHALAGAWYAAWRGYGCGACNPARASSSAAVHRRRRARGRAHEKNLMSETDAFLHALRFMTILPVRSGDALEADWLTRASKYFPAVGIVVGLAAALVFAVASRYWPGLVPAVLAVATSALLTGALHEDGLADTADGFGGGRSREARLA